MAVGPGGGAGLVAVAVVVTVAVTVGVAVCRVVGDALGISVGVGSTVVRLQASGSKKARPKINFRHRGIRDMMIITLS